MKSVTPDTTLELQSLRQLPAPQATSLFTVQRSGEAPPLLHRKEQPDWVFGILLSCFILVAWMMVRYRKRLKQLVSAAFSRRYLSQLSREGNLLRERISVSLVLIYILTFSLVLYEWNELYFNLSAPIVDGYLLYLSICLVLIVYWGFKLLAMNFLSIVFKTPATNHEYLLNILLMTSLTGLSVLPFLVLAVYLKSLLFLYICMGLVVALFLYRFLKGLFIGITLTRFSYLFLFVYLCGLELLPLFVTIKLIMNYFFISI